MTQPSGSLAAGASCQHGEETRVPTCGKCHPALISVPVRAYQTGLEEKRKEAAKCRPPSIQGPEGPGHLSFGATWALAPEPSPTHGNVAEGLQGSCRPLGTFRWGTTAAAVAT